MIVLDTNVVSETMRRVPDPAVIGWLDNQPWNELYLCAPVLAEIGYGIARLEDSRRKRTLLRAYRQIIDEDFEDRVLPFDTIAAEAYGDLVAKLENDGKTIETIDAMIAAVAQANGATLATRNTAHFRHTGLSLIDPFSRD
ncbi:MAG: type II toxin-antitoxin system VapC family toxin [Methyloceanibacter sp.]|uniref:type II toxin-antitoxin system VapC family toxin n=1 Tax=Methyloceanibacter sp. TaxID=1965321 RepID=UPI003EE0AAFE